MSAARALAIVSAFALAAALVLRYSHFETARSITPSIERSAKATASRATSTVLAESVDTNSEAERPPAPAREMIERDPEAAARLWAAHAGHVLRAKNRKLYGDEVTDLLDLPYDEAWRQLFAKAKAGDLRAATAASYIEAICVGEGTRGDTRHREARPASSTDEGLPPAMKAFVDRIAALHTQDYEERVSHCAGVGHANDAAYEFFDEFYQSDNVDAQIEVAGGNPDSAEAIADLRAIVSKQDNAHARAVLGDLLMQSGDAAERSEGRAMLEALAPDNPEIANRLAYCLQNGCGGAAPDLAVARAWFEASAGLGDQGGMAETVRAFEDDGNRAGMWAWSLYALDLALDGCFEMFHPSQGAVASAALTEALRRTELTPPEQNAGLAMYYEIAGRWEQQAREHLSCD
jgi:hypothetical protein